MAENVTTLKVSLVVLCAALTALWGWLGWLAILLVFCMFLDTFTGMTTAKQRGEWKSSIARQGLMHKVGTLISVACAGILDLTLSIMVNGFPGITLPFTYTVMFCPMVMFWYIFTELGSIMENVSKAGVELPSWLEGVLKLLRATLDKKMPDGLEDIDKKE